MAADNNGNTGFVLALVGAGAALAWLLWRRRGALKAGSGPSDLSEPAHEVVIRVYGGDRVSVDGVDMDLTAAVASARRAGLAKICPAGDTRHGWISEVQTALQAAGVRFVLYPLPHRTPGP